MMIPEKPPLEDLAHFGVAGMKWGQRKNAETGNGRKTIATKVAGAITKSAIKQHTKARDGKGVIGAVAKLDKATWGGNGRFEKFQNARISELERSKERIDSGELAVRTLLFGPQYSRIPKK